MGAKATARADTVSCGRVVLAVTLITSACAAPATKRDPSVHAPLSVAADHSMVTIAGGRFIRGSTREERDRAYREYEATARKNTARRGRWFENEAERGYVSLDSFRLDLTLVTNAAYAEFLATTGRPPPTMDRATWNAQGYVQDYEEEVRRFVWSGTEPPPDREDHPVVLVRWDDARAYCQWRGRLVGASRRLPAALELERAARGTSGQVYPWGEFFDPSKLNSAVAGPRDTTPVTAFPPAPSGIYDAAGNVFQWTRTRWRGSDSTYTVKGSAWDDFGGLGRGAANHGRPRHVRHAIVGFRCAGSAK